MFALRECAEDKACRLVCGHLREAVLLVITIYRPDPAQWDNWRTRKEPQ
jgi:hypothetical protein